MSVTADQLPQVTINKLGGIEVVSAKALTNWGVTIAFIGKGGAGKTSLAGQASLSAQYGGRFLHLNADGGHRVLEGMDNVDIVTIDNMQKLNNVVNEVTRTPFSSLGYGSICLDNMTQIQKLSIKSIKAGDQPTQPEWNKCTTEMIELVTKLRNYAQRESVNIFFCVGLDDDDKDENNRHFIKAGFTPALAKEFPYHLDIIGVLTVENNGLRKLNFSAGEYTVSKFRRNRTEAARSIPLTLYYREVDTPLVDLLETLKGGKVFPANKYAKQQTSV